MKKDKHKTVVQFYTDDDGRVFAYFPKETHHAEFKTCYAHIGQHSACHPDYIKECKPATDYKDLFEELESIGYNLEIQQPVNPI